ncbi:cyclase family protein [Amycolatopsis acidicola]|uniref:Cyclase family protein n=1 Tax=Amycolatopsis acidicola TaxID=2596893 RepID=A0A5N0V3A2_9PSEU|nr:cyclase family protein [Amycolatopsis acidicola]KAA9158101.1 cyclase family protein [Amycolatopsis acidicola]
MNLPQYSELPRLDDLGANHSWGVFGPDDELGTLNLLDARAVAEATAGVRTGERIGLSLPLDQPDPPLFRREPLRHTLRNAGSMWDDRLDSFFPQGSTQWDGFRHHRVRQHGFYGGVTDDPATGKERLSIHHWARGGIVGRGVLLDVAAHFGYAEGYALEEHSITPDDLRETARAQGAEIRPGDVLCVRTGWMSAYRSLDREARAGIAARKSGLFSTGLAAGEPTAELLWDWHIAAIAVDNPAVEVTPGDAAVGSLHRRLLGLLGIPLGELFDFDELAPELRSAGRGEFLFVSVPLALVGGLGSPGNAIAIL